MEGRDGQPTVALIKQLFDVDVSIDDAIELEMQMWKERTPVWRAIRPIEPGRYWFYGIPVRTDADPYSTSDHAPIEPGMHIVTVRHGSHTPLSYGAGCWMFNRPYSPTHPRYERSGWHGYWLHNSKFPDAPPDVAGLFAAGPDWKEPP